LQQQGKIECVKSGQVERVIAKGREEESTFSAVPSSRRSNEHDPAIMAALLRDIV